MTPHGTTEQSTAPTDIIYVDWPLARWSRNVSYQRGLKLLPYRREPRPAHAYPGQYPGGGVAA
jgi:hypothetical protein